MARPLLSLRSVHRLFAVLTVVLAASPAFAQDVSTDAAGESEILGRINAMRNSSGLAPLERDARLDAAARTHSADMAWHSMLAHVSPRTGDPSARVQAAGVQPSALAENVAQGADALDAHRRLVASEAHRTNMMNPRYTHIGISVVAVESGVYVTEVFAQLEAPAEAAAPAAAEEAPVTPPEEVEPWSDEAGNPAAEPAPAPGGEVEAAPLPEGAPTVTAPAPGERRVAGYWVHANGRWYYYPLPPGAQPGQVLQPAPDVTGPPPPHVYPQQRPGYRVYNQPHRRYRVYGGPPPPFGWSPRRQYWRWVN